MPTSCTNKFAFIFEDKNILATHLSPGFLRLNCFGDLAGFDTSYDKKRIRNMLNIVAKTFDTQEAMKNMNLKPILTGLSPDDLPLVGSLKHYPNVFVNVGHGIRALTLSFVCGQMIQDEICN
jgi:glycine/D-amino acid oxidase-like deaminating enzyme